MARRWLAVLHWEIEGKSSWLCRDCTRINTHIFLRAEARLLADRPDSGQSCSCCGRHDQRSPPPSAAARAERLNRRIKGSDLLVALIAPFWRRYCRRR